MKFEDLQRVWRDPATGNFKRMRIEDLSAARERAGSYLNHEMRIGMPLLTVLIVVAIPLFATGAISAPRPLLALPGAVLLSGWILSITAVWWKLWKARPNPGLPVRDAVHIELERLRTMQRFRSNMWYLPAFVAGQILLSVGLHDDLRESVWSIVGFGAAVLLLAAFARRKNRRDLLGTVRPLIEELESWTVDLEEMDPEPSQEESR